MFDGFWAGIFGGLFGSTIAQYLGKFRYLAVFLVTALSVPLLAFGLSIYVRGWDGSLKFFSSSIYLMIVLAIGFGLVSILLVFLASLNASKKIEKE